MKKIIVLLLALGLVIGLVGCAEEPDCDQPPNGMTAVLYLPCPEGNHAFVTTEVPIGGPPCVRIVERLVEYGALPHGVELLSFDGTTLNMNAAFAQALGQMGSSSEILMMGSLLNTFLTFYQMDSIYVRAEGEVIETEHFCFEEASGYFGWAGVPEETTATWPLPDGPYELTLYIAQMDMDGFYPGFIVRRVNFDGTAQGIVDWVLPLTATPWTTEWIGITVLSFENGVLNLDRVISWGHGSTSEAMLMNSLATTLLGYFDDLESITVLYNGEPMPSGHFCWTDLTAATHWVTQPYED